MCDRIAQISRTFSCVKHGSSSTLSRQSQSLAFFDIFLVPSKNRFENDLCIVISTSYQRFTPGSVFISSEYTTDMEKNKNKYIRWKALCLWCILACSSCSGTEIAVSCSKRQIMGSDSGMSPKLLSFLSDRVEMDSAVARKMLDWVIPWLKRDSYWFWELSTWQLLIERKRTGL